MVWVRLRKLIRVTEEVELKVNVNNVLIIKNFISDSPPGAAPDLAKAHRKAYLFCLGCLE